MRSCLPDGRGRQANVTGIALRHRRHHREPRRDAEISRGPTCRTACLACLLPQGTVGKEAGLNEGGYRSIGRAAAGCCLHVGDGGSGGADITHCDGARISLRYEGRNDAACARASAIRSRLARGSSCPSTSPRLCSSRLRWCCRRRLLPLGRRRFRPRRTCLRSETTLCAYSYATSDR